MVACARGVGQHAPQLAELLAEAGTPYSTVECFDKCETCERFLLVRIDGVMLRCSSGSDVVAAVAAMSAE